VHDGFAVPRSIRWLEREPNGAAWLAALPSLVAYAVDAWQLGLGEPYQTAHVSYVARVATGDGTPAVLKVQWPHRESDEEAAALGVWNGDGAVRLLAHDAERHTLLLERCEPGTYVADSADALDVFVELLPRLWRPAAVPFTTLADEAAHLAAGMLAEWTAAGRPCERRLVDAALAHFRDLAASQGEQVLLHQDLHGHNVLGSTREPWLAIDPKPLAGEREFGPVPVIRSFELGHTREAVLRRLHRLSADLDLDRERVRSWTIAHTVAWGFGGEHSARHLECAQWLLDDV
jgi:streptomycin 6-kinase